MRSDAIRAGWSKTKVPISPDMLVVDIGSGAFPHPRADMLCDRELTDDTHRAGAKVIYLRSTPEEVHRRTRHDQNRPLLQVDDPMERLRNLHAERDPLYRETAHFVIETGRPSVPTLVNMILMQLELAGVIQPK